MRTAERWLLYALGGGMGHLNRAIALARAAKTLADAAPKITLLTNSPFANREFVQRELGRQVDLRRFSPQLGREQVSKTVQRMLRTERFDRLVVDTFPRGLGGELADCLPDLDLVKVLVHRDLNPRYIEAFGLEQFVDNFDLLLLPGEDGLLGTAQRTRRTQPWLIRDADELLPRGAARRQFGVRDDRPLIVVLGCGNQTEIDQMRRLAARLRTEHSARAHIRLVSLDEGGPSGSAPFLPSICGVDLLVGAGGYNTVHEARAAGVPLIAIARKRLYDRQTLRLHSEERVSSVDASGQCVSEFIAAFRVRSRPPVNYVNGVHQALRLISNVETATRATH